MGSGNQLVGQYLNQYYLDTGEQVFSKSYLEDRIYISKNRPFLIFWGLMFLFVAVLTAVFLLTRASGKVSWFSIWLGLFLTGLPLSMAFVYLNRAKNGKALCFHLKAQKVLLPQGWVPFTEVAGLTLTYLKTGIGSHSIRSFHLTIELKNKSKLTIARSHEKEIIDQMAQILSETCSFALDQKYHSA